MRRSRRPSRLTALGAGPYELTGLNRQHNREHFWKVLRTTFKEFTYCEYQFVTAYILSEVRPNIFVDWGNARMAQEEREARVRSALSGLVQQFIRRLPGEDDDTFDERQENAYELGSSILESRTAPAVVADCEPFASLYT
jgi:hypothetical protein